MSQVLMRLMDDLAAGRLKVVDLTQPLGPDTPVIALPPPFAASPGLTIDVISRYDERGPAWYWNTLHLGEHTGTHVDAPVHWITGKDLPDNACDTIPVQRFIGPACVIDVTREVAQDADFLLRPEYILAWEEQHGRIPGGAWVLMRTDWSKRTSVREFFNADAQGAHTPRVPRERLGAAGARARRAGGRRGDGGHRRGAGRDVRSALPQPHDHARGGQIRPGQPV
jgi:isatin hydrolase